MTRPDFDVAIVGYGPVGAGAALLLSDAGLRVAVLERTTEIVDIPRAVGLDGEVVRAFQRIRRADPVAEILQPYRNPDSIRFTNSKREPLFGADFPPVGVNGWRDIAFFDQPELEAVVREMIVADGKVDLRLGHEVQALVQADDHVRLRAQELASGETRELSASYVIGCDGASSFVRDSLGIAWESLGYDQDWLVVDIVIGPEADLPLVSMQVCDPARLTTYVCVRDPNRRWEFQLRPGETREEMTRPERVQALLDDWLPREHYEIRRAAVYQFHAATASRWRDRRVFLAGDAAHQTPPFLGQGLNAGFRDAINLGWKLPLVIQGRCAPALLETYAAERDGHARDLVEWAVTIGKLMEALAAAEAGETPEGPSEEQQRSGYGQGRTVPPLRGGALIREQVSPDGFTGFLFSQPTVRTGRGDARRLDELGGPGFAVYGWDEAALAVSEGSRRILEALEAPCVPVGELEIVEGKLDHLFERHPAAIVRPDRYVFGVVDEANALDELVRRLADALALESGS